MLRRAAPPDLETLLGLVAEYCRADGHPYDPATVRRGMEPLLVSDDHGVVWMIEHPDGEARGYAVVTWGWSVESGGRDALLDEIYVQEPGHGFGGAAVGQILTDLRSRGLPRVFLETEKANRAARRLYARHGFEVEDSVWMAQWL